MVYFACLEVCIVKMSSQLKKNKQLRLQWRHYSCADCSVTLLSILIKQLGSSQEFWSHVSCGIPPTAHTRTCLHTFIVTWLRCPFGLLAVRTSPNVSLYIEYVKQSNGGGDPEHEGSNYSASRGWVIEATVGAEPPTTQPPHLNFALHLLRPLLPPWLPLRSVPRRIPALSLSFYDLHCCL